MMDPLLTVPPLTPSTLPSVVNLVNGGNCKQSNGHTASSSNVFKKDESVIKDSLTVTADDLKSLLEFFAKTTYKAKDTQPRVQHVMLRCVNLFGVDYNYSVLSNASGELSTNYPSNLIILESEKDPLSPSGRIKFGSSADATNGGLYASCSQSAALSSNIKMGGLSSSWRLGSTVSSGPSSLQDGNYELPKLKDLCSRARFARCRARFPVPVILYNQKHICRSATLSGGPEIYGRSSFDYFFSGGGMDPEPGGGEDEIIFSEAQSQSDWQLFDRVRSQDIRLLKTFQVETIVDLMVEKKKVKFGVNVTSSEKVDKENRYAEFNIVSLPYPGCEFFKQYRDNGYVAEELVFEWNQGHVDANICVPSDPTAASLKLDWSRYRDWDLVVLSQNYLKLLLGYLRDRDSGLLIHCISGWDRTPLFISLLRLSLWADGAIHKSLDADQILYLTLAYDWLLFGHNLEDRLNKGEEILFFCFNFLKYIVDPQFSINKTSEASKSNLSKVRNDSDVHLEGVLLDHEGCQTSPDGSNWSLNSYSSVQSTRSQEPAPAYFAVSNDSWEECNITHPQLPHLNCQSQNESNHVHLHSHPMLTTNGAITGSCLITTSMINSTTAIATTASYEGTLAGGFSKSQSPNRSLLDTIASSGILPTAPIASKGILPEILTHQGSVGERERLECGSPHGKTSPVAVPLPNRLQLNHHTRHESNSSASIGSWQLITGTGSLRENLFSTVSGSYSSHSHPSRLSANLELDCIEASESSCTLVEDLTPIESKPPPFPTPSGVLVDECAGPVNTAIPFEEELGFALEESFKIRLDDQENGSCPPDTLDLVTRSSSHDDENVLTASTTPTKEQEDDIDVVDGIGSNIVFTNNNNDEGVVNSEASTQRLERLDKVRSRFYSLYDSSIRTSRNLTESTGSGGGGLGFLIGNIATKVGIRTATHRTTHV